MDRSGSNLPQSNQWAFVQNFALAVDAVMPFRLDPEPIIRGLKADGYFVWDAGNINHGEGTGV